MSLYKQNKKMLLMFVLGIFFVIVSSINIAHATYFLDDYFKNETITYSNTTYTNKLETLANDFINQWEENKMPIVLHYYSPYSYTFKEDQNDISNIVSEVLNYAGDSTVNRNLQYTDGDYITYNYTNLMRREVIYARPNENSRYFITISIGKPISKENKTEFISQNTYIQHENYIQQEINNFIKEKNLTSKSQYDVAYAIFDYISHTMEFSGDNGEVYELLTTKKGNSHAMSMLAYRIYRTLGINDSRIIVGSRVALNQDVVYGIITKINNKYYVMDYATESLYYHLTETIKPKNSYFAIGTNSVNKIELSSYFTSSEFTQQYSISSTDYPIRPDDSSNPSTAPSTNPSTNPSVTPSANPSTTPSTNPSASTDSNYNIVISNKLYGNQADLNDSFEYTITLSNCTGSYIGTYNTNKESVTFYSSVRKKITLKHNEIFTISNVPQNTKIAITQKSLSENDNTYTTQVFKYNNSTTNYQSAINYQFTITRNTTFDFTNTNSVNVETGVVTKIVPFAILSVGAVVCLFFIFKKKKD